MAPGPQEHSPRIEACAPRGDAPPADGDVVITGMSGLLPGCHNVDEFARKLYNKENLVQKNKYRWEYEHPEIPEQLGRVPRLARFDAQFFKVHYRLGHALDAMTRKVMENAYQAIFDAGLSPEELSLKRVGVYIAVGSTETEKRAGYSAAANGMGLLGANRSMIANRVSYCLNLTGPSLVMDASCCGSLAVFEKAYHAITSGECDAAIIGGSKVLLHPQAVIHYHRMVPKNDDGKTKSYDSNADGQSMSEAIIVFVLQRYKDSKRVYASLCYAKTRFGVEEDWILGDKFRAERDPQPLVKFLQEFYHEAGIPPSLVEYVEGFGAAVPVNDKMELEAIEEVFCKDRSNALLVGSVMSNIGYTEAASGSCAVMKILLAYHRGELASNLHCDSPRQDIAALRDGRMRILTDHRPFRRSYAAVNGMSVTGLTGHALFRGHFKPKDLSQYYSEIPYLVTVSGRQESAVHKLINNLKTHNLDAEEIALMHNIYKNSTSGHLARGFGIFSTNEENETVTRCEGAEYYDDAQRPLWFVYSGMGSQWAGMGTQLLRIPIFAAAIERCRKVLEPKGVDIIHILTSPDKSIYDNIMHSFVGIAAVQIGLTDVLTSIGLIPDNIIGHSVGELGCAYADGCLTAEEMILASYSRGQVSLETPFIVGSMAAVGLGYEQVLKLCPPEIEVACHNGPESSTISGPVAVMHEFVAQLTAKGIFAKEVPCSNIAYHSRYIAKAGPGLLRYLSEVITTPRLRSDRWVSTSVPQDKWQEEAAKFSSAEYHTNNLLNPVLFEETARLIPSNAVVVEIAPHGLLQAILKKSLPSSCENISLTRRGHADNTLFLLEAIGRMYMKGYNFDLAALYPKVEFPVSTETPILSHLIEWVHDETWSVCKYITADRQYSTVYKPIITIYDEEYLAGHIIGGTRLYPFAGALVAVWDTLAMTQSKPLRSMPVEYRNIRFHAQPCLLTNEALHLTVSLLRGSGHFEVSYEYGLIAEGNIGALPRNIKMFNDFKVPTESMSLTSADIYKLLHERGYEYRGDFRSIHKMSYSLDQAQLVWDSNWVTLIDGLIQLNALRRPHPSISQPTRIMTLRINPVTHPKSTDADGNYVVANVIEAKEVTQCGGVTLKKISFVDKPSIMRQKPTLKAVQFFPFFLEEDADNMTTLYLFMQIIAENINGEVVNIFDIICYNKTSVIENLKNILNSPPEIKHKVIRINESELSVLKNKKQKPDVLVVNDLLSDKHMFEVLYQYVPTNTFIVSVGVETQELYPTALYRPVCARGKGSKRIELALWRPSPKTSTTALTVRNAFEIDYLQSTFSTLPPQHSTLILTCYPPPLGLKDIVKQQKKACNRKINVAMIHQKLEDERNLEHLPCFDLTYNLLKDGEWGGDYYLPLSKIGTTSRPIALQSAQIGNLDSLNWVEVPERINKGVTVTVHYAALNSYDAKRARAEIPDSCKYDGYGMDFSGITDSGQRVFGVVRSGALSSRVIALKELLWPVPDHWDLEDAATVALPYIQAFYCLAIKAEIKEGMRILIHGGAGALGQAAISIALSMRCEVFTTVSDIRKKNFLKQLFPNLKGSHIGNSRDVTFSDMVLSATSGAGCDVVINNLQGELKNASLSCCAAYGVTLDVSQIHMRDEFSYGMFNMTKARSYIPIDFSFITESNNLKELQKLRLLVAEGIANGCVRPLSRVTYAPHEAARAFRLLAASNHRGRVLLCMDHVSLASLAQPRLAFSGDSQQLLICDEEILSLQLVDRLINRGAKRFRLYFSKSSAYLNIKKAAWHNRGVQVDTTYGETWNEEKITQFLHDSKQAGLVESVFFIIRNYEHRSMIESTLLSLDIVSRELFHSLKHFTVISENQFFGRDICYDRSLSGLPSISLQLRDLEKFDEITHNNDQLSTVAMKWPSAVEIIEQALCSGEAVVFGYAQAMLSRTLLEEIALIPGVSITSTTDPRSTLEQAGVDQGRAQELCYMIQEKFDVVLSKEKLPQMTIAQLNKLQERFSSTTNEETGIKAYFQTIDEDEIVASTELVLMRTLGSSSEMRTDEFDMMQTYLCIIPGVEGNHDRFGILCERLKLPALVLQPSSDVVFDSVRDMAQRLVNVMMQSLKNRKSFYLLGYELGVLVALEMAAILENYGLIGTVFCLGGTSEDIHTSLEMDLGGMSEESLQNALLQHLTTLLGYKDQDLVETLQQTTNLDEKIDICVNRNREQVTYSSQFAKCYLRAAYNRMQLIRTRKSQEQSLRSKIVVMRAELPRAINQNSMAWVSEQPINIHELRTSLVQVPQSLQCSTIINKYIDSELLEKFKNRNLCDTYSPNEYMVCK